MDLMDFTDGNGFQVLVDYSSIESVHFPLLPDQGLSIHLKGGRTLSVETGEETERIGDLLITTLPDVSRRRVKERLEAARKEAQKASTSDEVLRGRRTGPQGY